MKGKKILLTRAREKNRALAKRLEAAGAQVAQLPLITVRTEATAQVLRDVFGELSCYQWIVFTSAQGVESFFYYFFKAFEDIRCIGATHLACVGQATKQALEKRFLAVDVMPERPTAVDLGKALIEKGDIENTAILLVQGNRNGPELMELLGNEGRAIVDVLPAYVTEETDLTRSAEAAAFAQEGADAVCFASPSAVEAYLKLKQRMAAQARQPLYCSIGPSTSACLRSHGLSVDVEATQPTPEAISAALEALWK